MRILFFGDIYDDIGFAGLLAALPDLLARLQPDFVIANMENMTTNDARMCEQVGELMTAGVDGLTSGNHIFNDGRIMDILHDDAMPVVRPANYPADVPGKRYLILEKSGEKLFVTNLLGTVFMRGEVANPFETADELLAIAREHDCAAVFLDLHAEATSEKTALGHYLDGRASAVVGTHTHIPTADEQILPGGTAYLTDTGMCGPLDSVIGDDKEAAIKRFISGNDGPRSTATGAAVVNGAVIELDDDSRARSIERIREIVDV